MMTVFLFKVSTSRLLGRNCPNAQQAEWACALLETAKSWPFTHLGMQMDTDYFNNILLLLIQLNMHVFWDAAILF